MGREVKRVALDFRWPIHMQWKGYVNPYRSQTCRGCGGDGVNPETKTIADGFYGPNYTNGWHDRITQDEVDALVERGRLMDFTHTWTREAGWQRDPSKPHPAAAEVNAWQRGRGIGHDAINRWILVETRARRLGVYGKCEFCDGEGEVWATPEIKAAAEAWEDFDPPAGPGWQFWETTSEGSPLTPVFDTPEELARYCADHGVSSFGHDTETYETWLGWFTKSSARSPSPREGTP